MNLLLDYTDKNIVNSAIKISGSKSESNRLLILKQWYPNLKLENLSDSDDTKHLLQALNSDEKLINIGHAGTAMRFLTAYFCVLDGREVVLTGSERMQKRPIQMLVNALRSLGAEIDYMLEEGYPPLWIKGKKLIKNKVQISGNVSSQYISALALIAPSLENGLEIELLGEITSRPYIEMTLKLLDRLGVSTSFKNNLIKVLSKDSIKDKTIVIESDWSSASYFYSLIALSGIGSTIKLSSYQMESLQGDSCLVEIYKDFGVETQFYNNSITIKKIIEYSSSGIRSQLLNLDLKNAPDLAQTIAVTCFGLGMSCNLTGLHTLKIKETDRLVALQNELHKLGAKIDITESSLHLKSTLAINKNRIIKTYQDHRMAMAFAPLALKVPITIEAAEVVSKSYANFWDDLKGCFKES